MAKDISRAPCPCHSQKNYRNCCKPFHEGAIPENALLLMRSRYAAYALALVDYIIDTTHKNHPSYQDNRDAWKKDLFEFSSETRFLGLEILSFEEDSNEAAVTFLAKLASNGRDASFTEKSAFLKESGRWLYAGYEIS